MKYWVRFVDERGATLAEYALLVALIAMVVFIGAVVLGNALDITYSDVASEVSNAG